MGVEKRFDIRTEGFKVAHAVEGIGKYLRQQAAKSYSLVLADRDSALPMSEAVRRTLAEAFASSEHTMAEVSRGAGKNHAYIQQFIERGVPKKLPEDVRMYVADVLKISERKLGAPTRREEPRRVSEDEEWQEELRAREDAEAHPVYGKDQTYRGILKGAIPEIDVAAGAGEGKLGDILTLAIGNETYSGHAVVEEWVFPEPYVSHELNAKKGTVFVMPVVGDSMEPTYRPGDRILVDTGQTAIVDDTVFVISDGYDGPKIKRLSPIFGSSPRMVQIVSDNQNVPMQTYPLADFTIIGRVVGVVSRR